MLSGRESTVLHKNLNEKYIIVDTPSIVVILEERQLLHQSIIKTTSDAWAFSFCYKMHRNAFSAFSYKYSSRQLASESRVTRIIWESANGMADFRLVFGDVGGAISPIQLPASNALGLSKKKFMHFQNHWPTFYIKNWSSREDNN